MLYSLPPVIFFSNHRLLRFREPLKHKSLLMSKWQRLLVRRVLLTGYRPNYGTFLSVLTPALMFLHFELTFIALYAPCSSSHSPPPIPTSPLHRTRTCTFSFTCTHAPSLLHPPSPSHLAIRPCTRPLPLPSNGVSSGPPLVDAFSPPARPRSQRARPP